MSQPENRKRVAIISGLRTPFARSGTLYKDLTPLDLGKIAVTELVNRTEINPADIGALILGNVMPSVRTPNVARDVALGSGIPDRVPAFTVSSSCASSAQAFTNAVDSILSGAADAVIAGGVECASENPYLFSAGRRPAGLEGARGKNLIDKVSPLLRIGASGQGPVLAVMPERYTGLTTGEAAEKIASEYKISRAEQDGFALRSHTFAARARNEGIFEDEIIHTFIPPNFKEAILNDNSIIEDASMDSLGALPPLFDREFGTVTTGNSAPVADGAAAILLMSEEKAKALGYKPLAYVKSYDYSASNPDGELLTSSVYAIIKALDRAGISLGDIDLVEMHEAFSAQVISNVKALSSKSFAKEKLGRTQAAGEIDMDRFNVSGGSIAIGHALGATGARLITTLVYRMAKRKGQFGLVALPASGGLGAAIVLEKE